MSQPHSQPHSNDKVSAPAVAAFVAIERVMKANQSEKGDKWKNALVSEHVRHAFCLLMDYFEPEEPGQEDHLSHALTRLAMAITLRSQGTQDEKETLLS